VASESAPSLYPLEPASGDALLEVFEAVDQAIGEILAKAPEDAYVPFQRNSLACCFYQSYSIALVFQESLELSLERGNSWKQFGENTTD